MVQKSRKRKHEAIVEQEEEDEEAIAKQDKDDQVDLIRKDFRSSLLMLISDAFERKTTEHAIGRAFHRASDLSGNHIDPQLV